MKTCLVIEDSALVREIAVRILKDLGLNAVEAASPEDAVDAVHAEKPAAVFLDWDLPSLGALDVLRGLGALDAEARPDIILCATENDPQQFSLAKAAGARHHILKPFDRESIVGVLAEIGLVDAAAAEGDREAS